MISNRSGAVPTYRMGQQVVSVSVGPSVRNSAGVSAATTRFDITIQRFRWVYGCTRDHRRRPEILRSGSPARLCHDRAGLGFIPGPARHLLAL